MDVKASAIDASSNLIMEVKVIQESNERTTEDWITGSRSMDG
jgi:hypothetical protein